MKRPALPSLLRQRGALAVETALAMPVLLGVGLLGADVHFINMERTRLENAAGAAALNLAAQPKLTAAGLDALIATVLKGHDEQQQIVVMNVLQSGRVEWALQRGGAGELCEPPSVATRYTGELPEDPPESEDASADDDGSRLSLVVVQACRSTSDITLSGGLVMPDVLETTSVFRATAATITLDDELQAESDASGLAYIGT